MMGDHVDSKKAIKRSHVVQVPLVNQCYSWDCGLACASMVLRMMGKPSDSIYTKDLDDLRCGESVWTIDLALILYQHKVRVNFYTIMLGVNADHANKSFYRRNFSDDETRVAEMFDTAKQKGIPVEKRSLGAEDLVSHLSTNNPIIVLVDWTKMSCLGCDSTIARCWSCVTCHHGPFMGHYVVLSGFDLNEQVFFYKNPDSKSHDVCSIPMDELDRARKSDGTDEDLLFIHREDAATS